MKTLFGQLERAFIQNANPETAYWMKKYLRDQFDFFGIKSPLRKQLITDIFHAYKLEDRNEFIQFVNACWAHPKREFRYAALDLSFRFSKKMDPTYIEAFELLIAKDSWWDTVDGLAPHSIGLIIKRNLHLRTNYCEKWIASDNIWYQRSAIILQLKFGELTDFELLKMLLLKRASSKEFFVQKASGWALRQYSKFHPERVAKFINENKISALAKREGMKIILKSDAK